MRGFGWTIIFGLLMWAGAAYVGYELFAAPEIKQAQQYFEKVSNALQSQQHRR